LHVTAFLPLAGSAETHAVIIVTDAQMDPGLQIEAWCVDGSWVVKADQGGPAQRDASAASARRGLARESR
jgi:hypothetical protein